MSIPARRHYPRVSVIIPCYNQAAYLGEALDSVASQDYPETEIVVINDGSTDDTAAVALAYSGVIVITQENQGLSAARNRGIAESTGELLVFLDADDRLLPGALQAGVACLEQHPECAFAYGQYQFIDVDGALLRRIEREPSQRTAYLDFLRSNRIGMHATVIYRRWAFDRVGRFNTSLRACEDFEHYLRIVRSFPVVEHAAIVAEYRRHPESISSSGRAMLEAVTAVLNDERQFVTHNPEQRAALDYGIRRVTGFYTIRIVRAALPPRINRRNWRQRLADLAWLARTHPLGILQMRVWLPEILAHRTETPQTHASV